MKDLHKMMKRISCNSLGYGRTDGRSVGRMVLRLVALTLFQFISNFEQKKNEKLKISHTSVCLGKKIAVAAASASKSKGLKLFIERAKHMRFFFHTNTHNTHKHPFVHTQKK